ncbi:hypothetical protein NECAME_13248 [Necator americanus]|uniref:Uncharacterized protein n=1 Tax=Necator americanus TaxID=51031 RepID=W2SYN7_NECAM|nr:hypothetical protein NECAME_13248 [Necator americanus]ETN74046.1 hypothetical protein NECAME_13248 [Necator americanus]
MYKQQLIPKLWLLKHFRRVLLLLMRQKATIGKVSEVGWYSPSLSKDWNQLYTIKVEIAKRRGEQVPETWGVESGGHLTTNPEKILAGGGLFPLGGSEISGMILAKI